VVISSHIQIPDLASPRFKANPYPFYARLRAEAPVCRTRVAVWLPAWLVTRYDDVLGVLKDPRLGNDYSARRPPLPRFVRPIERTMLNVDPPDHTRLRTLAHKAFTPRFVERLRERVQSLCDDMLSAAVAERRMDLVRDYALPLPFTVITDMLGIPSRDGHRFHTWTKAIAAASSAGIGDVVRALPRTWRFIRYVRRLCAERRESPQDDLVTALVQAEEAGDRLSEDELVGMIMLLLFAGYETTVHLVASGSLTLIQHPEQRRRFQETPALAESAIEELLRYHRERLQAHLREAKRLHERDLAQGAGRAVLPYALDRKYPNASTDWAWQFVFPASRICRNPRWGPRRDITSTRPSSRKR
jgi:cytochrome P450 PksS